MSGKRDKPGDARESALRAQEFLLRQGQELLSIESIADKLFEQGLELRSIRVKFPVGEGDSYLGVVKATGDEGAVIGFHDGTTYAECLLGLIRRLKQGSMKWREDEWDGGTN